MGWLGGKLNHAKPPLPWKRQSRNYPDLQGNSQCILPLWFSFLETVSAHSFLGCCSAVVIENTVNSAQRLNRFDKQRACESQMKFPTLAELRAPLFLDGLGFNRCIYDCDEEGKENDPFIVLTCSVLSWLPLMEMSPHMQ